MLFWAGFSIDFVCRTQARWESSFVEELHRNFRVFSVRDAVPIGMLIFDCPMIKKYAD